MYRYLLWRVGAESGGALRFRKCTKKQRNDGGLSRKKTPFPAFSASGKRAGAPSGEKADNLSLHLAASTTRAVYTPVKAGERKEKVGRFRREVERFSFLLPYFRLWVASFVHPRARVCAHSASFLIFAFTAALSPFNLLIFSVLWVKVYLSLFLLYCLVSQSVRGEGTICD